MNADTGKRAPGPWKLELHAYFNDVGLPQAGVFITAGPFKTIASLMPVDEVRANGELLAAAPDLLDALSDLVGLVNLLSVRADLPPDFPGEIRSNPRYQTAIALLKRFDEEGR